jgi:hypothetical protein
VASVVVVAAVVASFLAMQPQIFHEVGAKLLVEIKPEGGR